MIEVPKWIGISGSWRATSSNIEEDVRNSVKEIVLAGNRIVTGGALNVDYQATDQVFKLHRPNQIKVFLPTSLDTYAAHYKKRAQEGIITSEQAEDLIRQLTTLKQQNPTGLIENPNNVIVDKKTYYERNSAIINASDELLAFQVNNSKGVQDTIAKAKEKGIPIKLFTYTID